ncbi:Hypothetical predicted protein [Olea europaea subsp. europaea]|uniref:Uncharacterized protein n=1 Tax=Olea europaea subsp. europaea TaxID=158383 RepID=A0A8S0U676_OLEEU|nr:Hypothetical predicted protein [Olea europaea subsp. europaea]
MGETGKNPRNTKVRFIKCWKNLKKLVAFFKKASNRSHMHTASIPLADAVWCHELFKLSNYAKFRGMEACVLHPAMADFVAQSHFCMNPNIGM